MNATKDFYTEQEIRDRLSISTLVFFQFRPLGEGALKELTDHGIHRIELLQCPEQYNMTNARSMKLMQAMFDSYGIQVVAYHAHLTHFLDVDSESKRVERVGACRKQIDTMLELGGTVWGSHAGDVNATVVKSYTELARHVEGTQAAITVENFASASTWVEERVAFLDTIDHEQVGMILDIGHVRDDQGRNPMTMPGGPTRVLKMCAKHLRHVHLHGFKDGRDHHPPLVEGDTIQWVELFHMLKTTSYGGAINFEPSGEPIHSTSLPHTAAFPHKIVALAAGIDQES